MVSLWSIEITIMYWILCQCMSLNGSGWQAEPVVISIWANIPLYWHLREKNAYRLIPSQEALKLSRISCRINNRVIGDLRSWFAPLRWRASHYFSGFEVECHIQEHVSFIYLLFVNHFICTFVDWFCVGDWAIYCMYLFKRLLFIIIMIMIMCWL